MTGPRLRPRIAIGVAAGLTLTALLLFVLKDRRTAVSNSASETLPEEPFSAHDQAGRCFGYFTNLEAAVQAVPPKGAVELHWNGPRYIDPVTLPPKPLTIRAGHGFQPVWNSLNTTSALSASAALTLEGIRFQMSARGRAGSFPNVAPHRPRTPPSGLALLSITNGPFRIAHCTVEVKRGAMHQAGIVLANVGVGRVENTVLYTPAGKGIVWQRSSGEKGAATELTVTNCVTHAAETLWLDLRESPRARLEIARCTFHGVATFCIAPSLTTTNLEVNARQNVFHTASVILDARNSASPPLPQWLHWHEQENLYKSQQRYIAGTAAPDGPARLEDWNRWWNQTGVNSRVVQLTFANGASDLKRSPGSFPPEPGGFRITDLILVEGPSLEREQWSRFGAETGSVGPAWAK